MKFAPEYFEGEIRDGYYVQPMMKRVWAAQLEVLAEVDRICTKHKIKYIAHWGTLLGAVRHKGFIPWDDDVDLAMLREDYERFAHYAKKELPEGWRMFDCHDEGFNDLLIRVVNSDRIRLDQEFLDRFHGCPFVVGVDIFSMDRIPDDEDEAQALIYMMGILDSIGVSWKNYESDPEEVEGILQDLEDLTGQKFDRTKPVQRQLLHMAERASAMYWDTDAENVAMVYRLPHCPENRFPIACFDRIIRLPFENTTVPVVEDYLLMLEKYFGKDYMEPHIWVGHGYPFFDKQLRQLTEVYREQGGTLPERFSIFIKDGDKPLVSVIIPCYNVEKYIDRCLQSLMCQSIGLTNLQIICVDDASTDGTLEKLQAWEPMIGNFLTIVQCDVNGKQGTARNIGLEYATADYVSFIDADDWVEVDYFERLYRPLQLTDFDVVTCSYQRDPSDTLTYFETRDTGKESRSLVIDSVDKRKIFFNLYSLGHPVWGKIIKRELLIENDIWFPEQITYEDAYFQALLHFYTSKVHIVEEQLYHYFINGESTILVKDADHHTDWLTVQLVKWQTWEARGFLEDYREELEYEFLWSCYLGFLKLLALRYEVPSYSLFMLAKEMTLAFVPDYTRNKYVEKGFTDFQKILLETLTLPVNRKEFAQIVDMIRKHGV